MDNAFSGQDVDDMPLPDAPGRIDFAVLVAALTAPQARTVPRARVRASDSAARSRLDPELARLVRALAPGAVPEDFAGGTNQATTGADVGGEPLPVPAVSFSVSTARLLKGTTANPAVNASGDRLDAPNRPKC